MGDAMFCPNCGTRQEGLPKFCFACGQDLAAIVAKRGSAVTPAPSAPAAPGPADAPTPVFLAPPPVAPHPVAPPPPPAPPAWSVPSNQTQFQAPSPYPMPGGHPGYVAPGHAGTFGARPTGIAIIAILEVVGGVLGLWGALVLFGAHDLEYYYGYGDSTNYQLLALVSAAGAAAAFALAWGLWELRPWAWMLGVGLCIVSAAVYLLIAFVVHGDTLVSAAINVGVDAAVLYYLNLNSIRAIFGRPPTTLLQPQPAQGSQGPQPPQYPR